MAIHTLDDLVDAVQQDVGIPKNTIKNVLRSAFDAINAKTATGITAVRISNFGTFQTKTRAARTGRNPRTGEVIQIAESKVLSFKPTKHGK